MGPWPEDWGWKLPLPEGLPAPRKPQGKAAARAHRSPAALLVNPAGLHRSSSHCVLEQDQDPRTRERPHTPLRPMRLGPQHTLQTLWQAGGAQLLCGKMGPPARLRCPGAATDTALTES